MKSHFAAALVMMFGSTASAADLSFCWIGNNGYTMVGKMQVAPDAMSKPLVTEHDLNAFKIAGYHNGQLLGSWNMADAAADSTWHLRFDPQSMTFLTGQSFPTTKSQGWNANGAVRDCGAPGFGFNAGNAGQDICVNGQYVAESTVPPETPLAATTGYVAPDCNATPVFSNFQQNESFSLTANHPSD